MRLRNVIFLILVYILLYGCSSVGTSTPTLGLRPEYPENRTSGTQILFVDVDSLQPTFRWESFPRPHDFKADTQGMLSRIKNITYALKIWRIENGLPSEVIYSRFGLPMPSHKIEIPLETCAKYFWTVRARFELDGQTRVTEWGISQLPRLAVPDRIRQQIPQTNLYRFKTPCQKTTIDDR